MRLTVTVLDLAMASRIDVVVDAPAEARVGAVAAQLGRLARDQSRPEPAPPPALYVAGHPVDPELALGVAPIRDGSVVSLGDPAGCPLPPPAGLVELLVTGGLAAGGRYPLGSGTVTVGSDPRAGLPVGDPYLSGEAFSLTVAPDGRCRLTLPPGCPARLDGSAVDGTAEWPFGAALAVGGSLFEVARPARPDAVLSPSQDGAGLDFNRPPRVLQRRAQARYRLPRPPRAAESGALPIVLALSPLLLAVGTAVLVRQWAYLLIGLLSPVAMLLNHAVERRQGRKSFRRQQAEYAARRAQTEADAGRAVATERARRRDCFPDPARVLVTATGPDTRLWERRRSDADYLAVRVGTGTVDSGVGLEDPEAPDQTREATLPLADAPVVVPLRERGVLGVAGDGTPPRSLGRWIVAQLAVLHSPLDVKICLLTEPAGRQSWDWVRWLPHVRLTDDSAQILIGNDDESVLRRISELGGLLASRRRAAAGGVATDLGTAQVPDIVVVLDGARRLRALPGMVQLLADGPAVGIYVVCLESDEQGLPAECQAVVGFDGAALRVRQAQADVIEGVRPDTVPAEWGERLARALAPVRDISDRPDEARLPDGCRLLDLLGLEPPRAADVATRWRAGGRSTTAVIGVGLDGPVSLDLHRDGPHGLVAGTTGAGKSELLQTWIAALAVANRPDEMTFVLIDYKGGSAFRDCARLPHTVGMVTDLDGHLTVRALESLAAELRRRERLLADAGGRDIDDYNRLRNLRDGLAPLPRLLIVIDEFASLVGEFPDFIAGLVDIARRGRSLGVHLLLATQRPAGVVTPDIRANTNLRIALRVTDPGESADVIDVPAAARISKSTPGRLYVRSGTAAPQAVQSARIGGWRPGTAPAPEARIRVVPWSWDRLGARLPAVGTESVDNTTMVTDLAALVDAVRQAAASLGVPAQPSPWLPPLPDLVTVAALPPPLRAEVDAAPVPFGLTDLPAAQTTAALVIDLVRGGHLAVAGSPQSGRSTVLRTIAGALAAGTAPTDVHLYAIDCGGNALLPLTALPHCGAVVGADQIDRMDRLLARLGREVTRRQQVLVTGGYAGLAEQRAAADPPDRLPWMVLLLDRWEGFLATYESYDYGRLVDGFIRLLREGPAIGLRAVVTGDRSVLTGPVSATFERRLALRMVEPSDYGQLGIGERQVPAHMPPGRVLEPARGSGIRESQVALLDADPSGAAQVNALQRIASAAARATGAPPRHLRPLRVDALPVQITLAQATAMDAGHTPSSPAWALIGVGGDDLAAAGVDLLAEGPGFVVAGPPRSGRSTALMTMVRCLTDRGTPVVLITPRRSPLRDLAGTPGVLAVLPAETDAEALADTIGDRTRYVILVDDAELLRDTPLDEALADRLRTARDGSHAVVLAGLTDDLKSAYRGFAADALRSRSGLLLAPRSPDDGDMFGIRLPRNFGGDGPVGRAILIRPGATMPVQVALPGEGPPLTAG